MISKNYKDTKWSWRESLSTLCGTDIHLHAVRQNQTIALVRLNSDF